MHGRRLPLVLSAGFGLLGLAMVILGDAETRLIGLTTLLFFGIGGLGLAAPLLTHRREGTVRLTDVGFERGFLFPISRLKQGVATLAALGMASAGVLLAVSGSLLIGVP